MWLRLNVCGIFLYFQIKDYGKASRYSDGFCRVTIRIQSDQNIDICSNPGLVFEEFEVDCLCERLECVLNGQLKKNEIVSFSEPEAEFYLNPENREAKLRLYLWCGTITDNYFSLAISGENLKYFVTYLKLITRKLSKKDEIITDLLSKEIILDYGND